MPSPAATACVSGVLHAPCCALQVADRGAVSHEVPLQAAASAAVCLALGQQRAHGRVVRAGEEGGEGVVGGGRGGAGEDEAEEDEGAVVRGREEGDLRKGRGGKHWDGKAGESADSPNRMLTSASNDDRMEDRIRNTRHEHNYRRHYLEPKRASKLAFVMPQTLYMVYLVTACEPGECVLGPTPFVSL